MSTKFLLTKRFYSSQIRHNKFTIALLSLIALPITIYCYVTLSEDTVFSPVQYYSRNHKINNNLSSHTEEQPHSKENETKIDINFHDISKAERESLPTVSDVETLYGPNIVIDGLDGLDDVVDG